MRAKHLLPTIALTGGLLALAALPSGAAAPASSVGMLPQTTQTARLSVSGTGEVLVVPDLVSISLRVRARARSIEQALDDFRANRALLDKALDAYGDIGMTLESSGPQLGLQTEQQQVIRMNAQEEPGSTFEVKERIEARFPVGDDREESLRLIAAVVAAAVDVGTALDGPDGSVRVYRSPGQEEPPGPVAFIVSKEAFDAAYDGAAKAAFEDATRRGGALAALASRRLGPVSSMNVTKSFEDEVSASGSNRRSLTLSVTFSLLE